MRLAQQQVHLRRVGVLRRELREHEARVGGTVAARQRQAEGVLQRWVGVAIRVVAQQLGGPRVLLCVEQRDGQHPSGAGVGRVGSQRQIERGGRLRVLMGVEVGHAERVLHLREQRIQRRRLFEEDRRARDAVGLRLHDAQVQVRAGEGRGHLPSRRGALRGRQHRQGKRHVDGRARAGRVGVGDVREVARHLFAGRLGAVRDEALRLGEVRAGVRHGARGAQRPAQLVVDACNLRVTDLCGLAELQGPLQRRHGVGRAIEREQASPEVVERVRGRERCARGEFERRQRLLLPPGVHERRAEPEVGGGIRRIDLQFLPILPDGFLEPHGSFRHRRDRAEVVVRAARARVQPQRVLERRTGPHVFPGIAVGAADEHPRLRSGPRLGHLVEQPRRRLDVLHAEVARGEQELELRVVGGQPSPLLPVPARPAGAACWRPGPGPAGGAPGGQWGSGWTAATGW